VTRARQQAGSNGNKMEIKEVNWEQLEERYRIVIEDNTAKSPFVVKANYLIEKYGFAVSGKSPLNKITDVGGWNSYNLLTRTKGKYSPEEFISKYPQY
jgi:hypothetical protein